MPQLCSSGNVILLEDDDLDAELLAAQLARDGIGLEVHRAKDEPQFRALLSDEEVTLVLSDFNLPGYDGMAALHAARELAPRAPFIFVSGAIGEELAIETMRRGATDYVLKDRLERLGPAVRRALAEAESQSMRKRAEEERDRLFQAEREARKAAEDANRMKDDFLALVSHELRTPLNAIIGWASLLTMNRSDQAKLDRGLSTILRNARAQTRIIEDILDISRIVSGKLHLNMENVGVESLVLATLEAIRPAAAAREIELALHLPPDAGEIFADGERLQQVLWNLVTNAVKFTPTGGVVRVDVSRRDQTLRFEVSDTGCGINPELLPYVFERFRQGDSSKTRAHGGLGLGLSIVRHLTELHGGTVAASSEGHERGSTFTISLPIRTPSAVADPSPGGPMPSAPLRESTPPPSAASLLEGVRVLVLDDERDARELLDEVLGSYGADVRAASSVEEALTLIDSFAPDVVVSDIGMPQVDGYEFARRLRAHASERSRSLPAIALTAYTRDIDRAEAVRAGYQHHLAKPVSPRELIRIVADMVGRSGPAEHTSPASSVTRPSAP